MNTWNFVIPSLQIHMPVKVNHGQTAFAIGKLRVSVSMQKAIPSRKLNKRSGKFSPSTLPTYTLQNKGEQWATLVSLLSPLIWGTGGTWPRCISCITEMNSTVRLWPLCPGMRVSTPWAGRHLAGRFLPPTSRECSLPRPLLGQSKEEEQPTTLNTHGTQPGRRQWSRNRANCKHFLPPKPIVFYKTKAKHLVMVWRPTYSPIPPL